MSDTERITAMAFIVTPWDNRVTTKDGPRPAATNSGNSQGLARRYEGAPN